jgi:8-oxo-dGTP pyrophosphatase MutT (NUDIX family)
MPTPQSSPARDRWIDREVAGYYDFVACNPDIAHDAYGSPERARALLDDPRYVPLGPDSLFDKPLRGLALVGQLDWSHGFPVPQTVDALVATLDAKDELCIAIVERKDNGKLALPGGYLDPEFAPRPIDAPPETPVVAAARELQEEAGIHVATRPRNRDPRLNVPGIDFLDTYGRCEVDGKIRSTNASTFHGAFLHRPAVGMIATSPGDDAAKAMWLPAAEVIRGIKDGKVALHSDHNIIVVKSLAELSHRAQETLRRIPSRVTHDPQLATAAEQLQDLSPTLDPLVQAAKSPGDAVLSPTWRTKKPSTTNIFRL